ncbi:MAG TPA: hypothetical protein PK777_02090, partial [Thermoguttaceae bacterium]|nr:hypothetical protein [Thermoguttaceae bacterium]
MRRWVLVLWTFGGRGDSLRGGLADGGRPSGGAGLPRIGLGGGLGRRGRGGLVGRIGWGFRSRQAGQVLPSL